MRVFLCALLFLMCGMARAEKWALLIGINQYDDVNHITSLTSADSDAKALQALLISRMGVPAGNIRLLTSDAAQPASRPTRANILAALSRLKNNVQPGDTIFFFFSGHGINVKNTDYLLPQDFQGVDADSGIDTALAEKTVNDRFAEMKASNLILIWDKCRNDPFAKSRNALTARNTLAKPKAWSVSTQVVIRLFACAPSQSAYEWQEKGRGYFTYFLEEGLKGAAADTKGNITVKSLNDYLIRSVAAQVKKNENADQTPYPELLGPGAADLILATGKPGTATVTPPPDPTIEDIDLKARLTIQTSAPKASATIDGKPISGLTYEVELVTETTRSVEVLVSAPGYESKLRRITLARGQKVVVPFELTPKAESPGTPPPDPEGGNKPQPGVVTGDPAAMLQSILGAHNVEKLFALKGVKIVGAGEDYIPLGKITEKLSSLALVYRMDGKFHAHYVGNQVYDAGFDGQTLWYTRGGRPDTTATFGDPFATNPCWLLYTTLGGMRSGALKPEGKPRTDKTGPYLRLKGDPKLGEIDIWWDKEGRISQLKMAGGMLGSDGDTMILRFGDYKIVGGVPMATTASLEQRNLLGRISDTRWQYPRIEVDVAISDYEFQKR